MGVTKYHLTTLCRSAAPASPAHTNGCRPRSAPAPSSSAVGRSRCHRRRAGRSATGNRGRPSIGGPPRWRLASTPTPTPSRIPSRQRRPKRPVDTRQIVFNVAVRMSTSGTERSRSAGYYATPSDSLSVHVGAWQQATRQRRGAASSAVLGSAQGDRREISKKPNAPPYNGS